MMSQDVMLWLLLGVGLLVLELLTLNGALLLLAGVAFLVSLLSFLAVHWAIQAIAFSALAIGSLLLWQRFWTRPQVSALDPHKRAHAYIGRTFHLTDPVLQGQGRLKVDDTIWRIRCEEDLEAECVVEVIGVDATWLIVKKKNP